MVSGEPSRPPEITTAVNLLRVVDDPNTPTAYSRGAWPHWADLDGDRCDTREEILIAQSATRAQVDPIDCAVIAGDWVSEYDGIVTDQPGDLDIDHVVSLEDAHNSGGWSWTVDQRRAYANDPANLIAVSAKSNRSKGSHGPADWRAPVLEARCKIATTTVAVKTKYQLTVTTRDRDAIDATLAAC